MMQPTNDQQLFFIGNCSITSICKGCIKPLCEILNRVKNVGKKEIKQGPQLLEAVLYWSASQQKSAPNPISGYI